MKTVTSVKMLAIQRFREYGSGATSNKSDLHIAAALIRMSERAVRISERRYYVPGWILLIDDGVIHTCYKPKKTSRLWAWVHRAMDGKRGWIASKPLRASSVPVE